MKEIVKYAVYCHVRNGNKVSSIYAFAFEQHMSDKSSSQCGYKLLSIYCIS